MPGLKQQINETHFPTSTCLAVSRSNLDYDLIDL